MLLENISNSKQTCVVFRSNSIYTHVYILIRRPNRQYQRWNMEVK